MQDEVLLEFHVDDTAADDREDTLVEMAFHVPAGNERWGAEAQAAGADGEDAVATVPAAKVGAERCSTVWLHLCLLFWRVCRKHAWSWKYACFQWPAIGGPLKQTCVA